MTHERQHHNVTLAVLMVAALAYALSQTMVAPALPDIQHTLHTSTTSVTWVLTIYLLTASIATPVIGRLGDIFGKERVLVFTLAGFGVGSVVAALSHSIEILILGRAIQGAGGAVFPLAFGIIRDEFPREKVAQAIGLISATFGIGGGGGLVLAGVIVDALSYEWIFWLAAIVVVLAIVATHLWVPESPVKSPAKIDWTGAVLLSLGLAALLLGVSQGPAWGWGDARVLGLFGASLAVLVVWVLVELRVESPLVDMQMMRGRAVFTTNVVTLLVGFGMFGSFILVPQFVETPLSAGYGFGASVTAAGLFLLPSALVMLPAGPISGMLGARYGSKLPLLLGSGVAAASYAFLAAAHSERWEIYTGTLFLGVGIGLAFAAMANLIVEAVDQHQTGVATGMNTIMRTVGGAIGAQLSATILASKLVDGTGFPAESGYTAAFAMSAAGVLAALLLGFAIPGRKRPRGQAQLAAEAA